MLFVDGTVPTKVDLTWESEPKYIDKKLDSDNSMLCVRACMCVCMLIQ